MNPRKPPRFADWLLNRFGYARLNPPLAGDLLEEFRRGKSAAWFWRQTMVAIFTGGDGNDRRRLMGSLIGWGAEAAAAFALRRFHLLPEPPQIVQTLGSIALGIFFLWLLVFFSPKAPKVALPKAAESRDLPDAKSVAAYTWDRFIVLLLTYCAISLVLGMDGGFWIIQTGWLYSVLWVDVLVSRRNFQR